MGGSSAKWMVMQKIQNSPPEWSGAQQHNVGAIMLQAPSVQLSWRSPSCPVERPGLSSSEDQEAGTIGEMLGAKKSNQEDTVQDDEMASSPLKSVTVRLSLGLEFISRVKSRGQSTPLSGTFSRDDPVVFSNISAHCSECGPLILSDPGISKDGVKPTTKAFNQTDIPARKLRWPLLLCPPHKHLTKSASVDNMLGGRYRSHYWGEASGTKAICAVAAAAAMTGACGTSPWQSLINALWTAAPAMPPLCCSC